jgi:hypothetical protein
MTGGHNFSTDHGRRVRIACVANPLPLGPIVNAAPLDRRISENNSESAAWRATLVDGTHRGKQPLVNRRISNENVHRLAPHLDQLS